MEILGIINNRSALINRYSRLTGQAVIFIGRQFIRFSKTLATEELHRMFREFIEDQILRPGFRPSSSPAARETIK
ncbi:MAG TPA: hypothetical protein VI728_01390, partial [Syntrophales bacterium]|nr:hypothetical protein [Syntrophales bacterium]